MIDIQQRNPVAYGYLESRGFTGSTSGLIHSNIPMDQMIETTINQFWKSTKCIITFHYFPTFIFTFSEEG